MFTKQDKEQLLQDVAELKAEIKVLTAEREATSSAGRLSEQVDSLKRKLTDLRIEESKLTEQHEREKRETEHMVGLERRRQDFEIEQAKRETQVELREANVTADRERFEEQMKFITDRLSKEVAYLKDDVLKAILERLPTVTVDRTIDERRTTRRSS